MNEALKTFQEDSNVGWTGNQAQGPTTVFNRNFGEMKIVSSNPSGITPTEFKVLILPSPTEEVTKGGIIVPIDKVDKDKYATTDGVLVAMSHLAFTYVTAEEWGDQKPKPGMKVVFAKYAGSRRKGKDGLDYILINDKDIVATIED